MSPDTQQPQYLEFQQTIFDNVHGFIPLTDIEYRIIGTQEFQRLRNIRQLGLLDYIFPGALHTRFNHSLGVLYVIDKMVKSLQRKGHLKDNPDNRQILRLIGLLHDIGHYPWSHVTESVVIRDLRKKILSLPQREDKIVLTSGAQIVTGSRESEGNDLNTLLENSESHTINRTFNESRNDSLDFAHHERLASIVIEKTEIKDILMGSFSPEQIKKISQVIAATTPCGLERALIHSELDADRFDYLLRDSKQTGVTYGVFDLDQIIRNLDFSFDAPEGSSGLFVRKKGAKAVEDYLLARYFLYSTVIYQKASIGFQKIAHIIYEGLLERGEIESYCDIIRYFDTGDLESFYKFNDLTLLQKIRAIAKNDHLVDDGQYTYNADLIKVCCEKIIERKPLKLVVENQRILNKNESELSMEFDRSLQHPAVIDEIVESANIEKYWYIPSEVSTSVTNISPLQISTRGIEESILIEGENNIPKFLICEESLIIKQLAQSYLKIDAIYTKDKDYKEKILAAIEKCRMNREMWNRPSL